MPYFRAVPAMLTVGNSGSAIIRMILFHREPRLPHEGLPCSRPLIIAVSFLGSSSPLVLQASHNLYRSLGTGLRGPGRPVRYPEYCCQEKPGFLTTPGNVMCVKPQLFPYPTISGSCWLGVLEFYRREVSKFWGQVCSIFGENLFFRNSCHQAADKRIRHQEQKLSGIFSGPTDPLIHF